MRGTRWLLILTILAIVAGLAATYRLRKRILAATALPTPAKMPADIRSSAEDWIFNQGDAGTSKVVIHAHSFREVKDSGVTHLEGVRLEITTKEGDSFDRVQCKDADFTQSDRRLYSEGAVDITLKIPKQGPPKKKPVTIHATGLTYETNSNKASTERLVTFEFENGTGKAVGASYDPAAKQLHLSSQVELDWKGPGPNTKPMKIEAGEMTYMEGQNKIWLAPWAKLTRENAVMQSDAAVVTLDEGRIRQVDAAKGHGTDTYPTRKLDYAADHLWLDFDDHGVVERVAGEPNARVINTTDSSVTTMTATRVEMEFAAQNNESVLTHMRSTGNSVAESKPLPAAGKPISETRILRSAIIDMKMRPGGREIESAEVPQPGTLEFVPNRPQQRHRTLTGSQMWIAYAPGNRIQSFRTIDAATVSDPTPEEKARKREPARTSSRNLTATFDPKTNQMTRLEQWDGFVYKEGERNASAGRAILEQDQNLMTLETGARMWDANGSTFADHIHIDQKTGNFQAQGHVTSSHKNDPDDPSSDMLSGDEPLQAIADKMESANRNHQVHYQGKVLLWQGPNRLRAQEVFIDRDKSRLTATGGVVTELVEEHKDDASGSGSGSKPAAAPQKRIFTVVHADKLVYTDDDRLAIYTGGAALVRPPLDVKGDSIRAFLAEEGADSRLTKAFADGKVVVVQKALDRTRTGTADHAEYYTGEERVILKGGAPQLADTYRGITRGTELIYFVDDERLLVNGAAAAPSSSRVRAKKVIPNPPPPPPR